MEAIGERGGIPNARRFFVALYGRALEANVVGATLAFVYLSFVAPPQPSPPHEEQFLYLALAPVYFVVAAVVAFVVGERRFRAIGRWLDGDRPPTEEERTLILSLPHRAGGG